MPKVTNIRSVVLKFFRQVERDQHHRYRSWEHCFRYFQQFRENPARLDVDTAALHLGFYLASWGMYRGSTFLLWKDYKVHAPAVSLLSHPAYHSLWNNDDTKSDETEDRVVLTLKLSTALASAYTKNIRAVRGKRRVVIPTDTQVTKTLLGSLACTPACDRYFIDGFRAARLKYSDYSGKFLRRVYKFVDDNKPEICEIQRSIMTKTSIRYPVMKIVDMYFWQLGADLPKNQKALAAGK